MNLEKLLRKAKNFLTVSFLVGASVLVSGCHGRHGKMKGNYDYGGYRIPIQQPRNPGDLLRQFRFDIGHGNKWPTRGLHLNHDLHRMMPNGRMGPRLPSRIPHVIPFTPPPGSMSLGMATNVLGGHYAQIGLMQYHIQQYNYYKNMMNRPIPRGATGIIMPNYYPRMNHHLQQFQRYYNQTRMTP